VASRHLFALIINALVHHLSRLHRCGIIHHAGTYTGDRTACAYLGITYSEFQLSREIEPARALSMVPYV
jgi:hypothetical protein